MKARDLLLSAYRVVSRELLRERRRRFPDQQRLSRLKKERLALKDRLAQHQLATGSTLAMALRIVARTKPAFA
ncbi:YdcH family protein [Sphingobium olei]|uniref:YdcH family protein n=1 Tax=Sphingobium olei TaxID=420955 RepID=A0ABW3NX00_9SPHN